MALAKSGKRAVWSTPLRLTKRGDDRDQHSWHGSLGLRSSVDALREQGMARDVLSGSLRALHDERDQFGMGANTLARGVAGGTGRSQTLRGGTCKRLSRGEAAQGRRAGGFHERLSPSGGGRQEAVIRLVGA